MGNKFIIVCGGTQGIVTSDGNLQMLPLYNYFTKLQTNSSGCPVPNENLDAAISIASRREAMLLAKSYVSFA